MRQDVWSCFVCLPLATAALVGCGDSGGDGDGSGDAGMGADLGGGEGDTGAASGCEPPAGAEVVIPWTSFAMDDGTTAPAYGLLTDGTDLFVNFFERIVKVPLEGGTSTEIYRSAREIPLGFQMWADDAGIVVLESGEWFRVPYTGGTPENLTVDFPAGGRVFDWNSATDTFLVAWEDFDADVMNVDAITIGGGRVSLVSGVRQGLGGRRWSEGGGVLYVMGEDTFDGITDDSVYRFAPPAYSAEALSLTPAATDVVGADDSSLYYASMDDVSVWGLYRVSHTGGTSERISDSYWLGRMSGWNGDGTSFVNDATYLWHIPATGAAVQIASVPTQGCTTHEVMGHDGWAYTSTYNSTTGANQVWRIRF